MGDFVPTVTTIVVGYVVSQAVQKVGEEIGLSDSVTGIAAVIGGAYAGGMTYSAMTAQDKAATDSTTGAGDVAVEEIAVGGAQQTEGIGSDAAPSSSAPSNITPPTGNPGKDGGQPVPSQPQPSPTAQNVAPPPAVQPATTPVSNTPNIADGNAEEGGKSWFEKLYSSEKTWDMVAAGIKGYGEAGMAKEDREYPEQIREKLAAGWGAADPNPGGYLSLSHQYPSQQ